MSSYFGLIDGRMSHFNKFGTNLRITCYCYQLPPLAQFFSEFIIVGHSCRCFESQLSKHRASRRSEIWRGKQYGIPCPLRGESFVSILAKIGERVGGWGHCVLKQGFTRTFPRNQDVTVKLKSELIFTKFQYSFNTLANSKPICFT